MEPVYIPDLSAGGFVKRVRAWITEASKPLGDNWRCMVTVAEGSFHVRGLASEGPDLVIVDVVDDKGAKLVFLGTRDRFLFKIESCAPERSAKQIGYRLDPPTPEALKEE